MKTLYNFKNIMILFFFIFSMNGAFAVKWTVQVSNFAFTPANLPGVAVNDTITWVWVSGGHTTTSSSIPAGAASWDELITSTNTQYEYKVTVSGTYNYVCTPHIGMGMVASFTASGASPTLTVNPQNQNVSAATGSTSFSVTSNSNWSASSNEAWCSVTPSGSGNGTIGADYETNTSVMQRVANITVMVTGLPEQIVTVTQSGAAPTLTVTPSDQSVSSLPGSTTFSVASNTSWTTSSNSTWCTVTPSGSGSGSIIATFTENFSTTERMAIITVTVSGLSPATVTVTQDGSAVSVTELDKSSFRVYPNPSSGHFSITLTGTSEKILGYVILDITGKTIVEKTMAGQKSEKIDLSNQPEGIYFLELRTSETITMRKLIIRR